MIVCGLFGALGVQSIADSPGVASLTSSLGYCRVRTRAPIFGSVALPTRIAAGEHGLAVVDSLRLLQFWWCFVSDGMARRDSRKIFVSGLKQLGRTQITILSERASCRSVGHNDRGRELLLVLRAWQELR